MFFFFFFFKQKTAYEMRISDWSSDVCSSDLDRLHAQAEQHVDLALFPEAGRADQDAVEALVAREIFLRQRRTFIGRVLFIANNRDRAFEAYMAQPDPALSHEIGSAPAREKGGIYV